MALVLLGGAGGFGAARTGFPQNETEEQRYWKQVHSREAELARKEEQKRQDTAQKLTADVEHIVQAGAAIQPSLIEEERRLEEERRKANPPPPSFWKQNHEKILVTAMLFAGAVLASLTFRRSKKDAELRILTGKYLSDETLAAWTEMPELFAPLPALPTASVAATEEAGELEGTPMCDPREAFFRSFPEYLCAMREALHELGAADDEAQRKKQLADMAELISAFKVEANLWQLRPIMQVSTVLELLLRRLSEKTKDATPSALRTVAGALDLLADLAVPDLRPDLLVMPPLQIMAVDDEPLCLRAIAFALQQANLTPDLARDGKEAVALAQRKAYDVIFMDIQMPEMDGLTACTRIHEQTLNASTPLVFVTIQSDFQTRAKSSLTGGKELMAKPFLIFELTMKAVTYAARKRLNPTARIFRPVIPVRLPAPAPNPEATTPAAPAAAEMQRNQAEAQQPARQTPPEGGTRRAAASQAA